MDDELRQAERRGDAERLAALRDRAGLPPLEIVPLLPALRAGLEELAAARAEYDRIRARDRWGESSFDDALVASERQLDALYEALIAPGPRAIEALEWLALSELSPGSAPRLEALQRLAWLDDLSILERLAPSPDHEVHGPALVRLSFLRAELPTWGAAAVRAAIAGCQFTAARGEHLQLLARLDPEGSIGLFERHLTDDDQDAWDAAVAGLLAAGPGALDALVRATRLGAGIDGQVWNRLLELDRPRGLAAAVACVVDSGCDPWSRREATRQLLLEDRAQAWSALEAATTSRSAGFEPWRWLAQLDLPRAMTLAAERVAPPWPEDPFAIAALQAALDALVRCGDPRAEAVLLRERLRSGARGDWAAERLLASTQIRTGAWVGGWED